MLKCVQLEGVCVFIEFVMFNGKNYVEKYFEVWVINEKGEFVEVVGWFMGVCFMELGFCCYWFD